MVQEAGCYSWVDGNAYGGCWVEPSSDEDDAHGTAATDHVDVLVYMWLYTSIAPTTVCSL